MSNDNQTLIHLFHRDLIGPDYKDAAYTLAAVLAIPKAMAQADESGIPSYAVEHALAKTQNIHGSWSLKIGPEASDSVFPAHIISRGGEVLGLRSSMGGDVVVVDQKAYAHTPMYECSEVASNIDMHPGMTPEKLQQMLDISRQPFVLQPKVLAVMLATATGNYAGAAGMPIDAFEQATEHMVAIVGDTLKESQLKGLASIAKTVAEDHTSEAYLETATNRLHNLIQTLRQHEGHTPALDGLESVLNDAETPKPARSLRM